MSPVNAQAHAMNLYIRLMAHSPHGACDVLLLEQITVAQARMADT